jgi:deoxyribonuclease V
MLPWEAWPRSAAELIAIQDKLGRADPERWGPTARTAVGAVFVCFAQGGSGPGAAGDPAWGAAVSPAGQCVVEGTGAAPYEPGLLALREGPLLELAVRGLERLPDVLLVDATGRDHPRRAGLALHLGAVLDLPTVGVTHRPLAATGGWPTDDVGATAPLQLDEEEVGRWLRTRRGTRPLAVHAAWRTDPATAVEVVTSALSGRRTPEPLRRARTLARSARARA